MPISIFHRNNPGRNEPQVICDVCNEVGYADTMNVVFDGTPIGGFEEPKFVHKKCDGRSRDMWMPLGSFLVYLTGNAKVSEDDIRSAEILEG